MKRAEAVKKLRLYADALRAKGATSLYRWKDIAGIGNILRHDYQRIDGQIIWNAVKDDLPVLKKALLAIRASLTE